MVGFIGGYSFGARDLGNPSHVILHRFRSHNIAPNFMSNRATCGISKSCSSASENMGKVWFRSLGSNICRRNILVSLLRP